MRKLTKTLNSVSELGAIVKSTQACTENKKPNLGKQGVKIYVGY